MKTWIYISLAGLTLLVTLLGFLFGTDIVGRFSQPETHAERRVHATYSLKQAPFVHPQIIGDLIGMLSDVGDQVVAINLLDSQDSNRYFGEIFVTPQTDPLVPSWPWVSTRNRDLNEDEEGGDFPRQEYHAYRATCKTLGHGAFIPGVRYEGSGWSNVTRTTGRIDGTTCRMATVGEPICRERGPLRSHSWPGTLMRARLSVPPSGEACSGMTGTEPKVRFKSEGAPIGLPSAPGCRTSRGSRPWHGRARGHGVHRSCPSARH